MSTLSKVILADDRSQHTSSRGEIHASVSTIEQGVGVIDQTHLYLTRQEAHRLIAELTEALAKATAK
jgi:hypothetical protein